MVASLEELSELPLSDTEAEFRDEVRPWLIEHLFGDVRNQVHRGGPDDDDNWERVLGVPRGPRPGRS
jgi:hypothetical protein